jgi:hypothetical protein
MALSPLKGAADAESLLCYYDTTYGEPAAPGARAQLPTCFTCMGHGPHTCGLTQPAPLLAGRRTSIQHWQLRDLVHCPDKDSQVYCVHRHRVVDYSTDTCQVRRRRCRTAAAVPGTTRDHPSAAPAACRATPPRRDALRCAARTRSCRVPLPWS